MDMLIFSYTQEDALRDGVLSRVPAEASRSAGILVPVVITHRVHATFGDIPALLRALRSAGETADDLSFVEFDTHNGKLWAILDDVDGTPVYTILYPEDY